MPLSSSRDTSASISAAAVGSEHTKEEGADRQLWTGAEPVCGPSSSNLRGTAVQKEVCAWKEWGASRRSDWLTGEPCSRPVASPAVFS